MGDRAGSARFEAAVLPHLDAAYNLARWLTRDEHAAEDMVQEAYLRALKFFGGFRGGDGKAWILAIVRNACFDWLKLRRAEDLHDAFDENIHSPDMDSPARLTENAAVNPESFMVTVQYTLRVIFTLGAIGTGLALPSLLRRVRMTP